MTLWIDSDSCARDARTVAVRAVSRPGVSVTLVGDRRVPEGKTPGVDEVVVSQGADAADRYIEEHAAPEDLVVTRDLPFAERLTRSGIAVLNDSGEVYTTENIAERRSIRDFMYELRASGAHGERGANRGKRETQAFANALDRELSKRQPGSA
ncbi:MAG: hypothetical protein GVY29_09190 [Spirochaetes bacterium]|nr:hypothetical protein [Spirochaetota bacterium]